MEVTLDSTKRAIARFEKAKQRNFDRAAAELKRFADKAQVQLDQPISVSGIVGLDRQNMAHDIRAIYQMLGV